MAAAYFERAAELGFAPAQRVLGIMCLEGDQSPRDPAKAEPLAAAGAKVADGAYEFQITATNVSGEAMTDGVVPLISGKVSSVSFDESGQPIVHLGHVQLGLGQVVEILQDDASSASASSESSSSGDSGA